MVMHVMKQTPMLLFCLLTVAVPAVAGQDTYLGQVPPGSTPRIFAPEVVSKGNIHSRLVISPDGNEMFWNTVNMTTFTTQILSVRNVGGKWTDPQPPSFAKDGSTQSPMFSPDGKRLYFEIQTEKGWTTKYVERLGSEWSAPRSDGFLPDCSSSFARSGRAYFSAGMKTKVWNTGIAASEYSAKGYSNATALADVINVPRAIDYTPFVAPDESFLLFSSNRPLVSDKEDMHIHVSFRAGDGTWSGPKRVVDIPGRFPSLSPDGKYLFFCGDDGNIYWVEASVINSLKPPSPAATKDCGPPLPGARGSSG
jgi:hypothetical protein